MLSFVQKYAENIHSQNGEDGIIAECVKRLGPTSGHAVEVGANDGFWLSNSRLLIEQGWSATLVEADWNLFQKCKENWKDNPKVRVQCSIVGGYNVNAFVDDRCDVLSMDTDGSDYEIFKGLKAMPKIVIVEIDSSIPPNVAGKEGFNADGGSGYAEMVMLGYMQGYFLLCHTGNLIFVDRKFQALFPEITANPLAEALEYFNRSWLREEVAA